MALDQTILVRAGNMDEAKSILTGDITAANSYKATVTAHISNRLQNFRDGYNTSYPPNADAMNALYDAMVSSVLGYLDDDIPDDNTLPIADACDAIKQALIDYETDNGLTYPCPQCQQSSFIEVDGKHQFCPLSDGYTQTANQKIGVPSSVTYIDA